LGSQRREGQSFFSKKKVKVHALIKYKGVSGSLRSAGWSWRLELELCERKTLLLGWWLEAGAGIV